jgi:hypothetical protein
MTISLWWIAETRPCLALGTTWDEAIAMLQAHYPDRSLTTMDDLRQLCQDTRHVLFVSSGQDAEVVLARYDATQAARYGVCDRP